MSGPAPLFPEAHTRKLLRDLLHALAELDSTANACTSPARRRKTEALHRGAEQPAKRAVLLQLGCRSFELFTFLYQEWV